MKCHLQPTPMYPFDRPSISIQTREYGGFQATISSMTQGTQAETTPHVSSPDGNKHPVDKTIRMHRISFCAPSADLSNPAPTRPARTGAQPKETHIIGQTVSSNTPDFFEIRQIRVLLVQRGLYFRNSLLCEGQSLESEGTSTPLHRKKVKSFSLASVGSCGAATTSTCPSAYATCATNRFPT